MIVNTVLGAVDSADLGRTLIHEHLFASFPGAAFDPLRYLSKEELTAKCVSRLGRLKDIGVRTFVDPCPIEMGRDVELMADVSRKTGVHIVCATGFYHEGPGIPYYWQGQSMREIADFYISEITHGIGKTGVKPGLIKCATSKVPTELEERFLTAASMAHRETGVPILTHTTGGLGGPEQQAIFAKNGVEPHRCLIGHCCDNPDSYYHHEVARGGTYIGFDRIGFDNPPSEVIAVNAAKLIASGFEKQLMMSMDSCCHIQGKSIRKPPTEDPLELKRLVDEGIWPPDQRYLFDTFVPMLRDEGLTDAQIMPVFDENPIRFFAGGRF